jgi:hypothetical protein
VGKSAKGRLLPNPNVLIEYGWALKELSYSRIISVMNSAFGEPTADNMPFNLRHLRRPIIYHLDKTADGEETAKIKENLVNDLYVALKTIVESGILTKPGESLKEFDSVPFTSNPSTFLQPGETIPDTRRIRASNENLILPNVQRLFLRLIPKVPLDKIRTSKIAEDLCRDGNLIPMGEFVESWSYTRNKYGALACYVEDGKIVNMTQLFKSGEIWGIDADCIDKNKLLNYYDIKFGFFPSTGFETIFVWSLNNYLKFAKDILKLTFAS